MKTNAYSHLFVDPTSEKPFASALEGAEFHQLDGRMYGTNFRAIGIFNDLVENTNTFTIHAGMNICYDSTKKNQLVVEGHSNLSKPSCRTASISISKSVFKDCKNTAEIGAKINQLFDQNSGNLHIWRLQVVVDDATPENFLAAGLIDQDQLNFIKQGKVSFEKYLKSLQVSTNIGTEKEPNMVEVKGLFKRDWLSLEGFVADEIQIDAKSRLAQLAELEANTSSTSTNTSISFSKSSIVPMEN